MAIGIDYKDFWHMNPHIVMIYVNAYNKRKQAELEYDNHMAYIQGAYFLEALNSTVGNLFMKQGAVPNKYPDKPYQLTEKKLTKDEIEAQRVLFLEQLRAMQKNFELSHKGE